MRSEGTGADGMMDDVRPVPAWGAPSFHPSRFTRRWAGYLFAAPDGRTLYYGARQTEANIWMVRHAAPPSR